MVALPVGKVVLPTHKSDAKHHLTHRTAKQCRQIHRKHFVQKKIQNVLPNICLHYFASGLRTLQKKTRHLFGNIGIFGKQHQNRTETVNGMAQTPNEHIAAIAALPSFENNY